jgi:hypothetical protein
MAPEGQGSDDVVPAGQVDKHPLRPDPDDSVLGKHVFLNRKVEKMHSDTEFLCGFVDRLQHSEPPFGSFIID